MNVVAKQSSYQQGEHLNPNVRSAPSAYATTGIRLEELIDPDRVPIRDLNSPIRSQLVMECRADLERIGCSYVPD